ncbi:sarcocystatin-A-like [Musca vetustissima]|uniref:sarcocystatin-A-like n=1 Tax=Musca vetustissima TaxID=27455 RepID=UPI002AB5E7BF|nr:sarcocystatin-A-like [Musca vetustissima]
MADESIPICGGISPVSDFNDVEKALNNSLSKLAGGDGPNYKLVKIYSASKQVVSGTLTRIEADLMDENGQIKRFKISIWSQPWLKNGIKVTFECDGEPAVVRSHDP